MASEFSTVVAAGKGWTRVRTADGREYTLRGARNWRNNNPGNIEYGPFAQSQGAIGSDGRFAVFPSYDAGRNAKSSLLFNSPRYNTKTIEGAISKYAPPNENNTRSYINRVASALGLAPETPISALSPEQQGTMMDAMQRVEGFRVGKAFDAQGNIVDPSALQVNQTSGIMQAINNPPVPQQRPGQGLLASIPVERRELPAPAGLMSAYQPIAQPTEAQVSLDTLRQGQPQPSLGLLADQYASYGAGKAAPQQVGLLGEDVAYQRMINDLNAQKQQLQAGVNPMVEAAPWKEPTQVQVQAPEVAQVEPPELVSQPISQPQQFTGGLLSPQEQEQFAAQHRFLSQQPDNGTLGVKAGKFAKGAIGGIGGGLLGAALLGPIGGLLGAALGKSAMTGRLNEKITGFPKAPDRAGSTGNTGKISRGQLNDRGRDAYNSSEQFRDAVDRGSVGLY
ncbi:hypothetical protein ACLJYM_06455 [Rhizobium giardinii]|uniref:hypothetical protein n=1 Tax=Rhizobium giardinii TaxID=56731 RepID=UPI0039E10413